MGVGAVRESFRTVSEISERLTIMIVEHNIKGVLDIIDRAYVLDKGRVVFIGTPHAIRETDFLTQVFLGKSGNHPWITWHSNERNRTYTPNILSAVAFKPWSVGNEPPQQC